MGQFKPYCEPVQVEELNEDQKLQLVKIKNIMELHFNGLFDGAKPFGFFESNAGNLTPESTDDLRLIYSYCGLYASALDNDIALSYPDALLDMYRSVGVNAVWLPAVLYQLVPFPFDESYSAGWQQRIEHLCELVKKADKYGIKVYLYLNEPRCMPIDFFKKYPGLKGRTTDMYAAMCIGNPSVLKYLRDAVRMLCEAVPEIGGFFAITCYAYDDIDGWRSIYPKDVYVNQFRKLSDGWKKGLEEIENMPDCAFKRAAWGGYALFYSSYLQAEFVDKRDGGDYKYLVNLISEEKQMALLMYELMKKSSLFGYEAANHYYFNKSMLAEKVINCECLAEKFSARNIV